MNTEKKIYRIGILVGSARKGSYTRSIAEALRTEMPADIHAQMIPLEQLPLYNQDADANPPQAWVDFRQTIAALDGILIATPEYNRSMPALLKNALDVGSRPYGANVWAGKPAAVIGVSPGRLGAFGAVSQLRQVAAFLDMPLLDQPEMYIGDVAGMLDKEGKVNAAELEAMLRGFVKAYAAWAKKER